jgi:hypothetical protein
MGGLRERTARHTDERVRLTNELIQGALAMKMYGTWFIGVWNKLQEDKKAETETGKKESTACAHALAALLPF